MKRFRFAVYFCIAITVIFIQACSRGESRGRSPDVVDDITVNEDHEDETQKENDLPQSNDAKEVGNSDSLTNLAFRSGGDASTKVSNIDAFSQSPASIASHFNFDAVFKQGNALFRNSQKGVGPLLNNKTCQGCHIKDGRGHPPSTEGIAFSSLLIRLSLGNDAEGNAIPDPNYGTQLQIFGLDRLQNQIAAKYSGGREQVQVYGEARAWIEYTVISAQYSDGEPYTLRKPTYYFQDLSYGDFANNILMSPRVASPMIGLGLLGAIPESAVLAHEDINDTDKDGISGRARFVYDTTTQTQVLGRYGWKASTGSVLQQTANAFRGDIGLTTRFSREESCTSNQIACLDRADTEVNKGEVPDISDLSLASVEFYSRLLAVPERKGFNEATQTWDNVIQEGEKIFHDAQCARCHIPYFKTGKAPHSILGQIDNLVDLVPTEDAIAVLSEQSIFPYTDLLLHDMGGECSAPVKQSMGGERCGENDNCQWIYRCEGLADGRPDGMASGTEWRTPPLWGIRFTHKLNPLAGYLHDGRARTLHEAILWHGGEAQASRDYFIGLEKIQRSKLIQFLESL